VNSDNTRKQVMPGHEQWGSGGGYEPYVARWSRVVAKAFVGWLDPAPDARWLDIGCGTGSLSSAIFENARPAAVRGVDPSPQYGNLPAGVSRTHARSLQWQTLTAFPPTPSCTTMPFPAWSSTFSRIPQPR